MFETIGSRNEAGFVENFDRMGFDINKCGAEVISNSIDANATRVTIKIVSDRWILFIDDGIGMGYSNIQHMFDAQRENHVNERTIGVSGIGGKVSIFQMSKDDRGNPRTCHLFTKSSDEDYYKVTVPWNKIWKEKRYDKMISVEPMPADDIRFFHSCTKENHGTVICIPHSNALETIIREQFQTKPNVEMIPYDFRWSIIFGKMNTKLFLDHNNGSPLNPMTLYNYMGRPDTEYYLTKACKEVMVFRDQKGFIQYVMGDEGRKIGFKLQGTSGRCDRTLREIPFHPRTCHLVGTLKVMMGVQRNGALMNRHPSTTTCTYDAQFFDTDKHVDAYHQFCAKVPVIRNGHFIRSYRSPDHETIHISSNSFDQRLEHVHVRVEIQYETTSSQKNVLDTEMGIQQNKQQNEAILPKPLARLVTHLRHVYAQEINEYLQQRESIYDDGHREDAHVNDGASTSTASSSEYLDPIDYYDCQYAREHQEEEEEENLPSSSRKYYEMTIALIHRMLSFEHQNPSHGKELYDHVHRHFENLC